MGHRPDVSTVASEPKGVAWGRGMGQDTADAEVEAAEEVDAPEGKAEVEAAEEVDAPGGTTDTSRSGTTCAFNCYR